ncbi:hypothetical protein SAMN04487981_12729 [Streptomyces sp. cf386]|nr:hypothetical protein SAMN04487981_12729 [Streptomyces sp. cf386]
MPSTAQPPHTPTDLARHPHFTLPDFGYLPPAVYRSDIDAIEHDCRAWIRHHLGDAYPDGASQERFIEHDTTLWKLLAYPTARHDRITEMCNWNDFLFSLDDAHVYASAEGARNEHFDLYTRVVNGEGITRTKSGSPPRASPTDSSTLSIPSPTAPAPSTASWKTTAWHSRATCPIRATPCAVTPRPCRL